ncbi:hypothetical protein [Amycolatopsis sp. NPDC051903]
MLAELAADHRGRTGRVYDLNVSFDETVCRHANTAALDCIASLAS